MDRQQVRQHIRQLRRNIPTLQRKLAAAQLTQLLQTDPLFQRSQHIAGYIATDSEIDPNPICNAIWQQHKSYYLPVIHPHDQRRLWFIRYNSGEPLLKNRYGIPEPIYAENKLIPPWQLDLVLTPLVAFDLLGTRLGMGGGYYDHTFAFLHDPHQHHPRLIGLAYDLQKLDAIPREPWDIPLTAVCTEQQLYVFR